MRPFSFFHQIILKKMITVSTKINISEWFLKDHVTLKTEIMMLKIHQVWVNYPKGLFLNDLTKSSGISCKHHLCDITVVYDEIVNLSKAGKSTELSQMWSFSGGFCSLFSPVFHFVLLSAWWDFKGIIIFLANQNAGLQAHSYTCKQQLPKMIKQPDGISFSLAK